MNHINFGRTQSDITSDRIHEALHDDLPQPAEGMVQVFEPGQPGYWSASLATQQLAPLMAVYDDVANRHDRYRITAAFGTSGAACMGMLAVLGEGIALFGGISQQEVLVVAVPTVVGAAIAGNAFRKLPKGYRLEKQVKAARYAIINNLPLDTEHRQ